MTAVPELQRNIAKAKRARSTQKRIEKSLKSETLRTIQRKRAINPAPPLSSLLKQPLPQNRGGNSA